MLGGTGGCWSYRARLCHLCPHLHLKLRLLAMSSRLLGMIEKEPIFEEETGVVHFRSKAAIDTDGSGPLHGDKYAQADTSLHQNGKALNADIDCYVVVPPAILNGVKGVVLGCAAFVLNLRNGRYSDAVVGDIGPKKKLGEISVALAKALGIPWSPVTGGEEAHLIDYVLFPGKAAIVGKKKYTLQAS